MPRIDELITVLADGRVHSGPELARRCGCSRTAVWKRLHALEALGLEVLAETGRGYRLGRPLELLDRGRLKSGLSAATASRLDSLELVTITDSTNSRLRAGPAPPPGRLQVLLAEYQRSGRGRRGRRWLAPLGGGLCFSIAGTYARRPPDLPALGLAAGVAAWRALRDAGVAGLGLKWPNDLLVGGRKLGGLLVEVDGEADGPLRVIVGLGVNWQLSAGVVRAVAADAGLQPVALTELIEARRSRNALAAALVDALAQVLDDFGSRGFSPFATDWEAADLLRGRPVVVHRGEDRLSGTARGIDAAGNLLVATNHGLQAVVSGEVSLRAG